METTARGVPWPLPAQGTQLPQAYAVLRTLSPACLKNLVDVMSTFGTMLQRGEDVGDVIHAPWSDDRFVNKEHDCRRRRIRNGRR